MIVVSACLAGIPCRYDGTARPNGEIVKLVKEGRAAALCPECLAGLPAPRPSAEIRGGDGADVLAGRAAVVSREGADVTKEFVAGARKFLEFAQKSGAERVVLKSKSPSCGVTRVYDGSFSGRMKKGSGVTAALLAQNGISVKEV